MADLIIVRLHPGEQISPSDFRNYLQGLTITAYDLSYANPLGEPPPGHPPALGAASGLGNIPAFPSNAANINNRRIFQHYRDVFDPITMTTTRFSESIATAVIEVTAPPASEYPTADSYDVRLEISRTTGSGTLNIITRTLYYNVPVVNVGSLSNNQTFYFGLDPSAFVELPAETVGLDPSLAFVELPPNGQPPSFDQLVAAIDKVLAKDPGGANGTLVDQAPLSAPQSKQIAEEIIWNRVLHPQPEPPRPLGDLYTKPPIDPTLDIDKANQDRKQFEAQLEGYYATLEAGATRLGGFVYAASAAVACEKLSRDASQAGLTFPVITGAPSPTTIPEAGVLLTGIGSPPAALNPHFTVPAAFYYALGATLPPQVTPEQRYDMARLQQEPRLLEDLQTAIDAGIIPASAAPITGGGAINANQAARRLHALGLTTSVLPKVTLAAPLTTLVTDWLQHTGPTAAIDTAFWANEVVAQAAAYLELILQVVTRSHAPLVTAIKGPPHNVNSVAGLVAITDAQWRNFFLGPPPPPGAPPRIALLPPFTQPGSPAERVEAFIRNLRKFFSVPFAGGAMATAASSGPPALPLSIVDVFAAFTAAYLAHSGVSFAFGAPPNAAAVDQAVADVFPGDPDAQAWLKETLEIVEELFEATDIGLAELQFSLMEALYARGFTSLESIQRLSLADFQEALIGSVAYPHAAAIYAKALGAGGPGPGPAPGGFKPVNPDGLLTNCIPPYHLSPLGPVEYLHELLQVCATSTCEQPFPEEASAAMLGGLLAQRRGPLGDLLATRANLDTPLPLVDLVNESLEQLASDLPAVNGGAIHQTAGDELAGHKLGDGKASQSDTDEPYRHDPQTLFATMPEHSSPATPVAEPGAYAKLRAAFTSPLLPYPQALDINRSYLEHLGTSRFATMRHFRKDITEFAVDPAHEPADFQQNLWRLPVRFDTALEYLRISPEEYDQLYAHDIVTAPTPGRLLLREVYGFPADVIDGRPWSDIVLEVPEFLERTGLSYCEFLDLWRAEFVVFERAGAEKEFPDFLPCCPSDLVIHFIDPADPLVALRELAVFIRLWRRLQELGGPKISFAELRDICDVLRLFDAADAVNPDFLRQLAALLMLRDFLHLRLTDRHPSPPSGAVDDERTYLLALWKGPVAPKWSWAVGHLLDRIEDYAERRHASRRRGPEFMKILAENLDAVSRLAGFDPATPSDTWFASPAATLRFAEVLAKIYASEFTVGEILFLFTVDDHLDGDDPFLLPELNEALDTPLALPDEEHEYGLWALRRKLLAAEVADADAAAWTWPRIDATLRQELGFAPPSGGTDPLVSLGEHFFPTVLERYGHSVAQTQRQYRVALAQANTSPLMWNAPPDGPFRYDRTAQELWLQLPVSDEAVITKLSQIRPLNGTEQSAVRDLYFAPRAALAPFAPLFENFGAAVDYLVQEPDEAERWHFFQRQFALFYRRCGIIAEHLGEHVASATDGQHVPDPRASAWQILKSLDADENFGQTPWEDDSGVPPDVTWMPQPNGGAFAALLGLIGTGVLGEYTAGGGSVWQEVRGPLEGFGRVRDEANAPVPTILPSMGLTLTPQQQRFAAVRNGFALRDVNGEPLGGAEPFALRWSGVLLVENEGSYCFLAGAPTPGCEEPDFEAARDARWRVQLRRGQRTWLLLNHDWPGEEAPDRHSRPLNLRRGAYDIFVDYEQREPTFSRAEDVCPRHTGFQIKYAGPDTHDEVASVPISRLLRTKKTEPLGADLELDQAPGQFLQDQFCSTLRDIRRTYQRAYKGLLFAHRFHLSAEPVPGEHQSELGYMLAHPGAFLGTSYYRVSPTQFATHHAYFDFNLLPVADPYHPPSAAADQRVQPSRQRQAALFDWWERIFDYCQMRAETRTARQRPAWLLFYDASEHQPDDPAQLLRHLGIDIRHAPLVLTYFGTPEYTLDVPDLEDERWAVRTWQAETWLRELEQHFLPRSIGDARPDLWAADDPGVQLSAPPQSGNENLTRFVQDGCFENGAPRRYEQVKRLNDGLRLRARDALLAYLCGMDRVLLPWGAGLHAKEPRDLSDLLLQDVEAGIRERASRVEDAISAVQAFVQRARLGLEPTFVVTPALVQLWEGRFATFRAWETCKRREIYRENWIEWDELEKARRIEAFRFLEDRLRRIDLTWPVPGGLEWWPDQLPQAHDPITVLQSADPSVIKLFQPGPLLPEGLGLLGSPERAGRPSWLAPVHREPAPPPPDDDTGGDIPGVAGATGLNDPDAGSSQPAGVRALLDADVVGAVVVPPPPEELARLPLWFQAAIELGTRFIRVAAAGVPLAATRFAPRRVEPEPCCCETCGELHPPVMDEYYFWLEDARHYAPVVQDANVGAQSSDDPTVDPTSDWHRPTKLPHLLAWPDEPMVHLHWCRVHNGEFQQPRRSDEGLPVDPSLLPPGGMPELNFMGRTVDSLRFEVTGVPTPDFTQEPPPPGTTYEPVGFRYDLATDSAVPLPEVRPAPGPSFVAFPTPLKAYPFFIFFAPGARVEPPSPFSISLAVAGALRAHCRFEEALKWYELVYSPLWRDDSWAICPDRQPPPPDRPTPDDVPGTPSAGDQPVGIAVLAEGGGAAAPPAPANPAETAAPATTALVPVGAADVVVRRTQEDEPCCLSAPVDEARALDRALLLHYMETLLQLADALICRNTPESFQRAVVVLNVLDRILGPHPLVVLAQDTEHPQPIATFVPRPAPLNPRLMSLYDRVVDRLDLVRTSQNGRRLRNGRPNLDMPYWGNSPFRDGWQTSEDVCQALEEWCLCCCAPYRFSYVVQKALDMTAFVKALGTSLLAAFERADAEYLASLQAAHQRQILELTLEERQNQWREADWQVQALQKTKEGAQTRKRYYETLIANGLNAGEIGYEALLGVSMASRTAGTVSEAIAQGVGLTPDFWIGIAGIAGTPLQFNQMPLGNKLAAGFATAARILNALAEIASTGAALSLTQGGWDRREDEWRHQVEVIGIEIEQIERQILAAERHRDVALRELNNHQRLVEHAEEVQDFLRDKLTNQDLYLFLQRETAALYCQAYELARDAARRARIALRYELGTATAPDLPDPCWDNLHEGLLAGEQLELALRRMDKTYLDHNCREYELTKHISLRLNSPLAFLQLQMTGYCEVELPEWLFDLDYPGHYMRRIKNVRLTIPGVVGPYTGVHCRLTLLSSRTRVDPRLLEPPIGCCGDEPMNGYEEQPDDPRIVRTYAATEAIATSSGQNDAGLFELNFRDERYLPFEFAGAVSRWRIELPPENNQFDLRSLSDLVMHLSFTAREGGELLREAANEVAQRHLPGAGLRLFDVRHDFPDVWHQLRQPRYRYVLLPLSLGREDFPFVPGHRHLRVNRFELFFHVADVDRPQSEVVRFRTAPSCPHGPDEECNCGGYDIECVASAEWPGVYHGVLDVGLEQVLHEPERELGVFRFPRQRGTITSLFVVCRYEPLELEPRRPTGLALPGHHSFHRLAALEHG